MVVNFIPLTDTNEYVFVSMFSDYAFYDLRKYSDFLTVEYRTKKAASTGAYCYINNYFCNPDKYHILLIENEVNRFVGFCVLVDYPLVKGFYGSFFIEEFYIKEEFRGRGYGEAAVKAILRMYGTKGSLCILDRNVPAKRFWDKMFSRYMTNIQCEEGDVSSDC